MVTSQGLIPAARSSGSGQGRSGPRICDLEATRPPRPEYLGLGGKDGQRRRRNAVWGAEHTLLRAQPPPCKATRNPGLVRRATRPGLPPAPLRKQTACSSRSRSAGRAPGASAGRRGGWRGRAGASGLAPRPPRSAPTGPLGAASPALLPARSRVEAQPRRPPPGRLGRSRTAWREQAPRAASSSFEPPSQTVSAPQCTGAGSL